MSKFDLTLEHLGAGTLGVIGAGRLGGTLIAGLLAVRFPTERLLVAHGGSPGTRARLVAAGLSERIATVPALLEASRVVLLLVRPQSLGGVGRLSLRPGTLVVSFLAGVPIARLPLEGTSLDAARVIPSAPDTIERRMAIAGVYPGGHGVVEELLGALGIRVHALSSEDDLHAFTAAGVCLPIAFAYLRGRGTAP
ncbi:MAG TPA: NAD(P)-binding domain-containing protein, partial [Spirochaetia bacterium]